MSLAKKTAINMKHVVKAPFFLGFVHGKKNLSILFISNFEKKLYHFKTFVYLNIRMDTLSFEKCMYLF